MRKTHNPLGWVVFALLCIGIGWFAHQYFPDFTASSQSAKNETSRGPDDLKKADEGEFCAKIITPAVNPSTGEIQEFPTTCSVPAGWEKIENDIPDLDLDLQ
jgi:hypothetical protein